MVEKSRQVDNMKRVRDILNALKWRTDKDLSKAEITYVHRGVPGDTKTISGDEILSIEPSFMILEEASIPYHRILRIIYNGEVIFERK